MKAGVINATNLRPLLYLAPPYSDLQSNQSIATETNILDTSTTGSYLDLQTSQSIVTKTSTIDTNTTGLYSDLQSSAPHF